LYLTEARDLERERLLLSRLRERDLLLARLRERDLEPLRERRRPRERDRDRRDRERDRDRRRDLERDRDLKRKKNNIKKVTAQSLQTVPVFVSVAVPHYFDATLASGRKKYSRFFFPMVYVV
jgi:hypothetical protein